MISFSNNQKGFVVMLVFWTIVSEVFVDGSVILREAKYRGKGSAAIALGDSAATDAIVDLDNYMNLPARSNRTYHQRDPNNGKDFMDFDISPRQANATNPTNVVGSESNEFGENDYGDFESNSAAGGGANPKPTNGRGRYTCSSFEMDEEQEPEPELTEAELEQYNIRAEREIREAELKAANRVPSKEEVAFNALSVEERFSSTKIGIAKTVEVSLGRQGGAIIANMAVKVTAVMVNTVFNGITGIITSIAQGFVDVARLAVQVAKEIERFIEKEQSREGFLRALLYSILYQVEERCNVLVYNLNKLHDNNLKGWVYYKHHKYANAWFGVWVVEGGSFRNKDLFRKDEKWGFAGNFTISHDTVHFMHRPCFKKKGEIDTGMKGEE